MTGRPPARRKRRPTPGQRPAEEGRELRHSPYTVEGEIEGSGRLAGRSRRAGASRRRRLLAVAVVAAMGAPFVLQLVQVVAG